MSDLNKVYNKLFDDGIGMGDSPSIFTGGIYGGVPMGGGSSRIHKLRKSRKYKKKSGKKYRKTMRKFKKYSRKQLRKN